MEGKEYLFSVTACNKCGPGEPAYIDEPVNVSSPATVPDPPENLKWRDKSAKGIYLSWEPPKYDGGSGIKGYNVDRCQRGTDKWESCGHAVPELKLQVSGLTEGQWYAYRVRATNRLGASRPCRATDEILAVDPKEPPEIQLDVKLLAGLTAKAGAKIELPADVMGKPEPKITWTKADLVLKTDDDRISITTKPGHSTVTIANTKRDDTATYIIEAVNSSGRATATVDVNILDKPGPPAAFDISEITKESCFLAWNPPRDDGGSPVTNYIVERKASDSEAWQKLSSTVKQTTFKACKLVAMKEYTFRVFDSPGAPTKLEPSDIAKDSLTLTWYEPDEDGGSPITDPPWAPGKPYIGDIAKTSAFLQWTKPEHDGGAKIESYVIELLKSGTENWVHVAEDIPMTEHLLKGLMETQEYSFRVRAVNIAGESEPSDPSDPVVCKERLYPPSTPLWLEVINITKISAELKWAPPEQDGGSPITSYIVEKRDVKRKSWQAVDTTVRETQYTVTPLNEGSLYVFRVAAENAVGQSDYCELEDSILAKDTFTTPGPPYALTVLEVTKRHVDMKWEPPKNDGGRPITKYVIEKKEKLGTRWLKAGKTSVSECKYTVSDVVEGTEVQFQVRAENEAGVGNPSEPTEVLTIEDPTSPPSPPLELHITEASREHINITWKPPAKAGGSPVTGYHIELSEAGTEKWMRINSRPVKELKYKAEEGIVPEKQYVMRVRAINAIGVSDPSEISEKVSAKDPDCIPTIALTTQDIVVVEGGKMNLPVPYRAIPTPKVTWQKDGIELKADDRITMSCELTISHLDIFSCKHGDAGVYTVTLENTLGSATGTINVKVIGLPGQCKDIVASEVTKDSCKISWQPPDNDGGTPIVHYVLERREAVKKTFMPVMSGENKVSCVVKDLLINGEYYFRVKAVNKIGGGEYLENRNPVITEEQKQRPDPPIDVEVHNPTSQSVTLTWKPPAYDGGCSITGYILEKIEKDGDSFERCCESLVPGMSYTLMDLTDGNEYQFRVRAENAAGASEPSLSTAMVIAMDPVDPPKVSLKGSLQYGLSLKTGGEIQIDAWISGSPYPTVTWFRNDEPVRPETIKKRQDKPSARKKKGKDATAEPEVPYHPSLTERLSFDTCKKGEYSIMIRDSIRSDHGNFMIKVENLHGVATASCKVNVLGEEYMFRVVAKNRYGCGPPVDLGPIPAVDPKGAPTAPEKFHYTERDHPSPPQSIVASDIKSESCYLTWDAPEDNGGSEITNYIIESRDASKKKSDWEKIATCIIERRYGVSKLETNGVYQFRISAENKFTITAKNIAGQKVVKVRVNVLDIPGPPKELKVSDITRGTCRLTWKPPDNDGGERIQSYFIEKKTVAGKAWTKVNPACGSQSFVVPDLIGGEDYLFRVRAENCFGMGPLIETIQRTKARDPIMPPDTPTRVKIRSVTKNMVTLTWKPPRHDGGAPVTHYNVEQLCWDPSGMQKESWRQCNRRDIEETIFNIEDLNEGGEYEFRVKAVNEAGAPQIELNEFMEDEQGADIQIVAKIKGCPFPTLTWQKAPPHKSDAKADVQYDEHINKLVSDDSCTLVIQQGKREDTGVYTLTASNSLGKASKEMRLNVLVIEVKDRTIAPEVDLDAAVKERIVVHAGGVIRILAYVSGKPAPKITWSRDEGPVPQEAVVETTAISSALVIKKCTRKHQGIYTLTAKNEGGERKKPIIVDVLENEMGVGDPSPPSKPILAKDPIVLPGPPVLPQAVDKAKDSVSLSWHPPRHDGKGRIFGYIVEYLKVGDEEWTKANETPESCPETKLKVMNLADGAMYKFRVMAVNAAGSSEPAYVKEPVKVEDRLEPPELLLDANMARDHLSMVGTLITLSAVIKGMPFPTVTWKKNGADVPPNAAIENLCHNKRKTCTPSDLEENGN
ncbi:hypothetical protein AAFF_G00328250 [Aldrovandia affinis]|uniref:Titin n=1 Tax=Aldrovandia affinis TaxID=143900 RepID=A0AAD7TAE7_9TELE|nr:hypothetical protein AAFF_G00328250 [Aldrovandia affinis]